DGQPFYGGTYFPATRRYGMPSFKELLNAVAESWRTERGDILRASSQVTQQLRDNNTWNPADAGGLRAGILGEAAQVLLKSYDWEKGGWGRAPRFPQPMAIEFLMLQATRGEPMALETVIHVLERMSRGGMYDLVGGGFHRYSTDDEWLVPHFEKMLYDNTQLALAYLHGYLMTGRPAFRQVCEQTLDFITREMTHPEGGFFSSLDADSEGEEGKYYLWSPEEIHAALPDPADRELFGRIYPVPAEGNFEGRTILQRKADLETLAAASGQSDEELIARLDTIHRKLLAARSQRIRPATDDKVLVMWNALALRAFAQAARYLHRADYLEVARRNAQFLTQALHPADRLLRAWRDGLARHNAYLEDYAALVLALLDLYQSDPNPQWYQAARMLGDEMLANFSDARGGFFDTRADHGELITRPKETQDNATPSGNALAASALLHLAALDERGELQTTAEGMIASMQDGIVRYPTAFAFWLQGLDFAVGPVRQIAVVGPLTAATTTALLDEVWRVYRPRTVVAAADGIITGGLPTLLSERGMLQGKPTAYVCHGFTCKLPVNTAADLQAQLAGGA
ncbi:MAG TPA: thioredoxin domain-containing protein, partial [Anaerolineaceae bacterium]